MQIFCFINFCDSFLHMCKLFCEFFMYFIQMIRRCFRIFFCELRENA